MFCEHVATAIGGAMTLARLDELAKEVWSAWGAKALTDEEAGQLSGAIEARKAMVRPRDTLAIRAPHAPRLLSASFFPPKRRRPVSPDRAASRDRRRRLAASGPLPPVLAALFTTGELAALRIVADEVRARKACELTIGEIAARAGVGETTARNGVRAAAAAGLLLVIERRRSKAPNLPNVVRIVSREWLAWIARRPANPVIFRHANGTAEAASPAKGGGFKKAEPTDKVLSNLLRKPLGSGEIQGLSMKEREAAALPLKSPVAWCNF